jgi:hypothetical protein
MCRLLGPQLLMAISSSPDLGRRAGARFVVAAVQAALGNGIAPRAWLHTPSFSAISLFIGPLAAASTMRARSVIACGALCLRVSAAQGR